MKIARHNLAVRFTHWLTALSIFILFFSGFGQMPIYKRYYVDQLPGLSWSSDFLITLHLHYWAAAVLIFISVYFAVYIFSTRSFDIIPKKGDFRESLKIIGAMLGLTEEPESDKYLAEQRLAFAVTAFSIVMLIITGLIKVYKNLPGTDVSANAVFWTAQIHNLFTVILLVSIVFHLGAFFIKANRPLLPSMFTGKISAAYVQHRHQKWWHKLEQSKGIPEANEDNIEAEQVEIPVV